MSDSFSVFSQNMMMENVNYGREELMFLNLCRKGLLGELLQKTTCS